MKCYFILLFLMKSYHWNLYDFIMTLSLSVPFYTITLVRSSKKLCTIIQSEISNVISDASTHTDEYTLTRECIIRIFALYSGVLRGYVLKRGSYMTWDVTRERPIETLRNNYKSSSRSSSFTKPLGHNGATF